MLILRPCELKKTTKASQNDPTWTNHGYYGSQRFEKKHQEKQRREAGKPPLWPGHGEPY